MWTGRGVVVRDVQAFALAPYSPRLCVLGGVT